MPARTDLGVWLDDTRIGTLRGNRPGRVTFQYQLEALERWPLNSPVLSCSLPLRRGRQDAWAFSTGLLPEGEHRQSMAQRAGVTTLDVMGMLSRFGRDVAGAVIISEHDPPVRDPQVEALGDDGLAQVLSELDEHPLGLYEDSELSIAGLQDKMLLVEIAPDRWGRPRHGYPSTHILKVDDRLRQGLVREEHACLTLARAAGLRAAGSRLMTIESAECIVVERFDRRVRPDGSIVRIHQEDACQALGINPDEHQRKAKYEAFGGPSLAQVAGLLEAWAADPEQELLALVDAVTFTVLIGNADAHGKNLALLHPEPGAIALAPLYDTVPTVMWPRLRPMAAMSVNGRQDLTEIGADDLVTEGRRWSLDPAVVRRRVVDVAERVLATLRAGQVDVDSASLEMVRERAEALMSTA